MSRKNYVYDNGKTHKERVNVYQSTSNQLKPTTSAIE